MLTLDDLHDAILDSVTLEVDAKTVALAFTPIRHAGTAERITLIAHDWRLFSCPRQAPWGHASPWRLNAARGPLEVGGDVSSLQLEMQTGDTIEVHAVTFERIDLGNTGFSTLG
jgi:hypothetical protein